MAALLPVQCALSPRDPCLREIIDGEELTRGLAVVMKDAGDFANGECVIGCGNDLDDVPGTDVALFDDAKVCAWPAGCPEQLHEAWLSHTQVESPARHTGFADLQQGCANSPSFSDEGFSQVDALSAEVLPETADVDAAPEIDLPPTSVLVGVRVDGLVRSAVGLTVGLVVHPSRFTPRARMRSDTGDFQIAVVADLPFRSI